MDKQGKILGIPFDFRKPTYARMKQRMWNPDDERIMTPRTSGIGWTVNLYQLRKRSPLACFYVIRRVGRGGRRRRTARRRPSPSPPVSVSGTSRTLGRRIAPPGAPLRGTSFR